MRTSGFGLGRCRSLGLTLPRARVGGNIRTASALAALPAVVRVFVVAARMVEAAFRRAQAPLRLTVIVRRAVEAADGGARVRRCFVPPFKP